MASGEQGFSKEERAAMKERAAELRADAKRQKSADKAAAELQAVLDAHAAMPEEERAAVLAAVGEVVDALPGDRVAMPYATRVTIARRAS